ncbi:MAG TPA: isoleucine--tRNA ligase, partial [Bacteroidetes bacterium]|nr:isoleucine--tRNA ligase [Bacteroidota bacterium]
YIISLLHETIKNFTKKIEEYDVFGAMAYVEEFLESLANWYIRRSRRRFWKSENDKDKIQAYHTLYEVLTKFIKLLAPVIPFLTEGMYQNLARLDKKSPESIHLCDYPIHDDKLIDQKLNDQMRILLGVVSLIHAARDKAQIKVRQPLNKVMIFGIDKLDKDLIEVLADEVNVKNIEFNKNKDSASEYAESEIKLNFKALGEKYGKDVKEIQKLLGQGKFEIKDSMLILGKYELNPDEYDMDYNAKEGFSIESDKYTIAVLDTEITNELKQEGMARDFVRFIQDMRKEADYKVDDRIIINYSLVEESQNILKAIDKFEDYIKKETLAIGLNKKDFDKDDAGKKIKIDGQEISISTQTNK